MKAQTFHESLQEVSLAVSQIA